MSASEIEREGIGGVVEIEKRTGGGGYCTALGDSGIFLFLFQWILGA